MHQNHGLRLVGFGGIIKTPANESGKLPFHGRGDQCRR
jgi:hypothetical protein